MAKPDAWSRRAHQAGYRSRAAYKLRQLDDSFGIFEAGQTVVDLGAAPGGWLQVAGERVGESGYVIGVDLRRISPIDDIDTQFTYIQGDITESDTIEKIESAAPEGVDIVLSDMAPNITGEYGLDHARSIHLAETALELARSVLGPDGAFVVKVFDGPDLAEFRSRLERDFAHVTSAHPPASRDASSEVYLVGRGFLTAPVRSGDRQTVEITGTGAEGDGVATIEGFRIFVPDTEPGDTVEIEITDVKPRFGFARCVSDSE